MKAKPDKKMIAAVFNFSTTIPLPHYFPDKSEPDRQPVAMLRFNDAGGTGIWRTGRFPKRYRRNVIHAKTRFTSSSLLIHSSVTIGHSG